MKKKKLSYQAEQLLLLVDHKTERDEDGKLKRYFVPSVRRTYELPFAKDGVFVGGAGDARIFKSLESKGLIHKERLTDYSYSITEDGRITAEEILQTRGLV